MRQKTIFEKKIANTPQTERLVKFIKMCDNKIEKAIHTEFFSITLGELRRQFVEEFVKSGLLEQIPKTYIEISSPKTIYGSIVNLLTSDIGDKKFEDSLKVYSFLKKKNSDMLYGEKVYRQFIEMPKLSQELFFYYIFLPKKEFTTHLQNKLSEIKRLFSQHEIDNTITQKFIESIVRDDLVLEGNEDKSEKIMELVFMLEGVIPNEFRFDEN